MTAIPKFFDTLPSRTLIATNSPTRRIELSRTPNGKSIPAELAPIDFKELAEEYAFLVDLSLRLHAAGNDNGRDLITRLIDKIDFLREEASETLPYRTVYGL